MVSLMNLLTHLLFFYMLVGEPVVAEWLYRNFIVNVYLNPRARIGYYYQKLSLYWSWIAVITLIGLTTIPTFPAIWISSLNNRGWGLLFLVITTVAILILPLAYRGKTQALVKAFLNFSPGVLPVNRNERLLFATLAISSGVSEELVYRGFVWYYLQLIFPFLPVWSLVIISAFLFTAGHYFQSRAGTGRRYKWWGAIFTLRNLGNLAMGLIYGAMVAFCGSLLPSIILHVFYDLYFIVARPRVDRQYVNPAPERSRMSRES